MERISVENAREFMSRNDVCLYYFKSKASMGSVFAPDELKEKYGDEYKLWFANLEGEWKDSLLSNGEQIKEVWNPTDDCPYDRQYYLDRKDVIRIVFWNFGRTNQRNYKFVGVFKLDENNFSEKEHYYNKISDVFPLEEK